MSLKTFHFFFVTLVVLMSIGLGIASILHYRATGEGMSLVFSVFWGAAAVAMLVYGRYVLKKLKGLSYL